MDPNRLDTVARLFARRKISRRQTLTRGAAGVVSGALTASGLGSARAGDATPQAGLVTGSGPTMLFLQSFRGGSIVPRADEEGRYTVTLEQGLGQTIYFSDRPDRIVGAMPTDRFLNGLGFPEDNPPNAALVIETEDGATDIAVVELFNPVHDPETDGVTYDVAVLANWETSLELGFTAAPSDLSALAATFGTAHLFIDDCPASRMYCTTGFTEDDIIGFMPGESFDNLCFSPSLGKCAPCTPWLEDPSALEGYWSERCNAMFDACNGTCFGFFQCKSVDPDHPLRATMCML